MGMNNVEKNTIDYMRLVAKERGGDCLSKKYVNARTKLKWQCSCSKTWFATPSDILRPSWCRSCSVGLMERVCRCYFEQIFGEQFPNIRPKWLVNPKTGQKLEIDGYSEKLKVAFEYQGIQHIRFNSLYHKTESDFQNRLDLDLVKAELIKQKGIKLVLINQIPTFLKYKDLRGYLLSEFKRLKIKHPPFPKDFDLKNAYKTNDKYFLDRIKNAAKELGGRLKSEVYLGTHVPHDFECGKGHGTFSLKPAKLLTDGRWCQKCSSEKKKNDVDLVTSNEFKKFKIVFISGSYEKISSKLRWKCLKCNEEFNSTISGLRERIKLKNEPCLYCVQGYKRNTSEFLLDYEQAKIIVHKLGLKSQEEWKKYCNGRLPHLEPLSKKIPKSPWVVYKKSGWISLGDWLGTEVVATHKRKYRPFKEARDFARSLKLKSSMEWILFSKNKLKGLPYYPSDIPKLPNDSRYKNEGWKSWADWLGTNNTKGEFWDFEKAKKFVRRLSLSSTAE